MVSSGMVDPRLQGEKLRWNIRRRLTFIEFRLVWEGQVNRADLEERFDVSVNQASKDLSRYQNLAPGNLVYDKAARCYRPSAAFEAMFGGDDPRHYLTELRLRAEGPAGLDEGWISVLPPTDLVFSPARHVGGSILRPVLQAIHERRGLRIRYQSMSSPDPALREIEPHALAFDGFRWHARAWRAPAGGFRDFVLGRMLQAEVGEGRRRDPADDTDWQERIALQIAPHPALTAAQAKAIALDYGMEGGRLSVSVRRALLFYVLKRLGLDTEPAARAPERQHIVLLNRDSVLPGAKLAVE